MTAVGELCLWAAVPFLATAAFASVAGGWSGRRVWGELGGRAAVAGAVLMFVAVIGLAYALIGVDLRYNYVARYSGFQQAWPWRLAALWSGPGGATLTFTFLLTAAAAVSQRGRLTRGAAARTGGLALLALFGLIILIRTGPFSVAETPESSGFGLPHAMASPAWQVEGIAALLAAACAAFAFAGLLGQQLVESPGRERAERGGVVLAAGLLTVAVLAAAWRAYRAEGRLLDVTGVAIVLVHVPAWLLAIAQLHAPAGLAAPAWAVRWRRILGVALFPTALGDAAALLAAGGAPPPAVVWGGALAVGILSGAMAGMARDRRSLAGMEVIPGYGLYAGFGGLAVFTVAGLAAGWGLLHAQALAGAAWLVALLGLTGAVTWSSQRPAGGWKRVAPAAFIASTLGAVAVFVASQATLLALAAGLTLGLAVGLAAELVRLARARRTIARGGEADERTSAHLWRSGRRWASAVGHLGVGLLIVGLAADVLVRTETRTLRPGEELRAPGGGASLTYLGLSRYQVGDQDREVASFRLDQSDEAPRLITAASTYDWAARRQFERPALQPGLLRDIVVSIAGRAKEDGLVCRVSVRPLASLVWLGGLLIMASTLARGRPAP